MRCEEGDPRPWRLGKIRWASPGVLGRLGHPGCHTGLKIRGSQHQKQLQSRFSSCFLHRFYFQSVLLFKSRTIVCLKHKKKKSVQHRDEIKRRIRETLLLETALWASSPISSAPASPAAARSSPRPPCHQAAGTRALPAAPGSLFPLCSLSHRQSAPQHMSLWAPRGSGPRITPASQPRAAPGTPGTAARSTRCCRQQKSEEIQTAPRLNVNLRALQRAR